MTVIPQRRVPERTYKDYKKYKKWLREDFHYRCAYCFIHENEYGGYWHFWVDHYRPKSRSEFKHLATEYSNLLYSCDQCNNLKGSLWPSDNPLLDGVGWLDPCEHDLHEHYYYGYHEQTFKIVCLTKAGSWMVKALALDQPARLRRRFQLAEEEQVDKGIIEHLSTLVKKFTQDYNSQPTDETLQEIDNLERLLLATEELMRNRYAPAPFESLQRRSICDPAESYEETETYQSILTS